MYKMENYVASKFKINKNQNDDDYFIYNDDDVEIKNYLKDHHANGNQVKIKTENYENGILSKDGNNFEMSLKGKHNFFNAACVVEGCRILGLSEEEIQKGLTSFKNLPHRLEPVANINGVEYINDSKATNVDSVYYALDAMDKPVVWIAGGTDKGNDYSAIKDLVKSKVKALICMGVDNSKLLTYFENIVPTIVSTDNIKDAVNISKELSVEGDIVLLSPACASFDLFQNYMDRGERFKKEVFDLI
jgi:UDP-N-acetylmuramoylalanine--D-glutamate ligase